MTSAPHRKASAVSGSFKRERKSADRTAPDLRAYNAKRRFALTPEPQGIASTTGAGERSFVVQQHDASHMHFDFRLEIGGVLVSWAIPKGPSLSPRVKRLAVQTEDHPIDYREFEGLIPQGEYGGGKVIVWDRGTWACETDPQEALDKGAISLVLEGEKLRGGFSLVRTSGKMSKVAKGPKSSWLLIKRTDAFARNGAEAEVTQMQPQSVISGRLVAEADSKPAPKKTKTKKIASRKRPSAMTLSDIELQLATLVDRPPESGDWIYEIKFDGYRMLAQVDADKVQLRSRNGLNWSETFPTLSSALLKLKLRSAIFDGEVCMLDSQGRSSFQQLQKALPRGGGDPVGSTERLAFQIFDLLEIDGVDLRNEPLLERKQRLQQLLGRRPPRPLIYSDHLRAEGRNALNQACAAGLEGLIAKRPDAPYRGGRGRDWIKIKCQKRQEFVIVGMSQPKGGRDGFGSLLIAARDKGQLRYAGRVGTGFSADDLRLLKSRLDKLVVENSPVVDPPKLRDVSWVKPVLVCEVEFTERTDSGLLRHPSFQGLRQDKAASEVVVEKALPVSRVEPRKRTRRSKSEGLRITHPERVIDATSGTTKGELARYHEEVAPWIMPYAQNRPLALVRCPQGDAQACFFQRHAMRGLSKNVHRRRVEGQELLFVDESRGLLELVQFNATEFHGWGCTIDRINRPDWIVMDLDPDTRLPFSKVIDAALEMRDVLARLKLQSFVKTTGGKGLHVVLPLTPNADWTRVKAFSRALATSLAEASPDRYVATASKAKRSGKIFIDYLRNESGSTAVLPYSPRARPGVTVAMPVEWKDLHHLDPRDYTVRTAPAWIAKRRHDPWADFHQIKQSLPSNTSIKRS